MWAWSVGRPRFRAEVIALPEDGYRTCGFIKLTPGSSRLDDKEVACRVAPMEYKLVCGIPCHCDAACARHWQLNDVRREQQLPCPVAHHFKLAGKARKFAQIDPPP